MLHLQPAVSGASAHVMRSAGPADRKHSMPSTDLAKGAPAAALIRAVRATEAERFHVNASAMGAILFLAAMAVVTGIGLVCRRKRNAVFAAVSAHQFRQKPEMEIRLDTDEDDADYDDFRRAKRLDSDDVIESDTWPSMYRRRDGNHDHNEEEEEEWNGSYGNGSYDDEMVSLAAVDSEYDDESNGAIELQSRRHSEQRHDDIVGGGTAMAVDGKSTESRA